jgi:hypothetical protein
MPATDGNTCVRARVKVLVLLIAGVGRPGYEPARQAVG